MPFKLSMSLTSVVYMAFLEIALVGVKILKMNIGGGTKPLFDCEGAHNFAQPYVYWGFLEASTHTRIQSHIILGVFVFSFRTFTLQAVKICFFKANG